eukprot:TRINITY_DN55632_c0_g1_i1.p1 TRINITY_DN55632_c0_g1~~TRINITY_DN55632_c0_g1_i1.p1  ORF type:complete len:533 (+),score=28.78 TRINITY_DN55632_c0_g1_i1:57-1655(+)
MDQGQLHLTVDHSGAEKNITTSSSSSSVSLLLTGSEQAVEPNIPTAHLPVDNPANPMDTDQDCIPTDEDDEVIPFPSGIALFGTVVGNILEWYDFGIFSAFEKDIADNFFSENPPVFAQIKIFVVYASAFVMRPIGGLVLGYIGDKYGRTTSLQLSVVGMGLACTAMTVLPSSNPEMPYAISRDKNSHLPIIATLLMVVARIIQGLSVGGELVGSMVYSVETSPREYSTFLGAIPICSATLGTFSGFLVATLIGSFTSEQQRQVWGWRVGFGLGLPLTIGGFFLRKWLRESKAFLQAQQNKQRHPQPQKSPVVEVLKEYKMALLLVFLVLTAWCLPIWFYVWARAFYMSIIASSKQVQSPTGYIIVSVCLTLVTIVGLPCSLSIDWNSLSNTQEREKRTYRMFAFGALCHVVFTPLTMYLFNQGSSCLVCIVLAQAVLGISNGIVASCFVTWMVRVFPTKVNYTALAISYNLSQAVFAGTAPLVCTALAAWWWMAPGLFVSFWCGCGLLALVVCESTAKGKAWLGKQTAQRI